MSAAELSAELAEWPVEPDVAGAWRELAVARENPFISPEWLGACVEALDERPRVVVCRGDGVVRGVVPLVEGSRGRARSLRFPGGGAGDVFEPACEVADEEAVGAAAAAALAEDPEWDVLELSRLLDGGSFVAALAAAWPGRGRLRPLRASRGEVYPFLEFGEDGIDGWLKGRSRSVREDLGKRTRRLERAGAEVRGTADGTALEANFAALESLHDARWGAETEAMAASLPRLHRAFAAAALERGWLRLSVMELEGEAVAATYAWMLGRRYMLYISGYDPAYRSRGVGSGLMSATIRAAAEEGAAVYDLMRGDEGYKRRLETGRRSSSSHLIARPGSARGRSAALEQRAKELGRRLPAGPRSAAGSFYRRLRG
jgi:CelD/BcsL family acetyltransferase involved in cellulose biosynthesis